VLHMETNVQLRGDEDQTQWGVDQREKEIGLGSLSGFNQNKEKLCQVRGRDGFQVSDWET
jgi:hypothetical protein